MQAADISDPTLQRSYQEALSSVGKIVPYLAKGTMLKSTGLSNQMWNEVTNKILFSIQMRTRGLSAKEWNNLQSKLYMPRQVAISDTAQERIEDAGLTLQVTASIGIASMPAGLPDVDLDDLMRAADQALYGAKRNGRNCVVASDSALRAATLA